MTWPVTIPMPSSRVPGTSRIPNGHRLELLVKPAIAQTGIWSDLHKNAYANLARWERLKRSAAA